MMGFLLLIGSVLSAQAPASAGEGLRAEVARLVRQLDAPQLARREAAESELLRHGPAILDFLPPRDDRLPPEVQQRLGRLRQKLQQAEADASTTASTITLHADNMSLADILQAFQKQSGNTIVDYRRQFSQPATDPKLSVDFHKTPFWPALDQLLDQAGLTLYPYGQPGSLSIVAAVDEKGTARFGHANYSGPFRFEPISVVARRNVREPGIGSLVVTVEAAWEPRLKIIKLTQPMADVVAMDDRGERLPVADRAAQPEVSIGREATAVKLDIPLQLPSRDVRQIASLKGKLLATVPGKIETFRFSKLSDAKNVEQRIAGVTVTLEKVHRISGNTTSSPHPNPLPKGEGKQCEIRLKVRFDNAGDALASHRQWIFENKAFLESPDGKPIAYETFETTAQSKNEIGLAYRFQTDQPLDTLTFVYQTPGTIVTRAFEYELKEIALP
jgi:hypothetical protein